MIQKRCIFSTYKIFPYVIAKYLLAFVFLFITQLVFYIVNASLFSINSVGDALMVLLGNIHFGISTTAMVLMPYFIMYILPIGLRWKPTYKKVSEVLYIVLVSLMMAGNLIDTIYFQWTLRRTTGDIFKYLTVGGDMGNLVPQFLSDFWMYVVGFVVLIVLLVVLSHKIELQPRKPYPKTLFKDSLLSAIFAVVVIVAIRGGLFLQYRPLSPIDAGKYTSAENTPLIINTPFSIIKTFNKDNSVSKMEFYGSDEELEKVFSPLSYPLPPVVDTLVATDSIVAATPKNVVLIILESFSEEYIGALNPLPSAVSYTPFLDSLIQRSIVYKGMANGKRSIEAIPACLAGMPTLMDEPYITSSYSMNKIEGLPQILKRNNYHTSFFHGAYNGSMNFDSFVKTIGVDNYYGMNEYNDTKDYDGNWGIFDEPFLQFMVDKLSDFPQPFFTGVFTLSSHHPYTIPRQHIGRFAKGPIPILEPVMYVDYALQKFFEKAQQTDWYANTLFVITADHAAQAMDKYYKTDCGIYKIPMIFYYPGADTAYSSNHILQQIDLMPTIIDYLNIAEPSLGFGKSIYQTDGGYHLAYRNGCYQLLKDGYLLRFNLEKFELYNVADDPLLTNDIADQMANDNKILQLKNYIKAVIQQYNNRLISNKLLPNK